MYQIHSQPTYENDHKQIGVVNANNSLKINSILTSQISQKNNKQRNNLKKQPSKVRDTDLQSEQIKTKDRRRLSRMTNDQLIGLHKHIPNESMGDSISEHNSSGSSRGQEKKEKLGTIHSKRSANPLAKFPPREHTWTLEEAREDIRAKNIFKNKPPKAPAQFFTKAELKKTNFSKKQERLLVA